MDDIISNILSVSPFLLLKIPILILLALYIAFTFIVFRQTSIMAKIVEVDVSGTVQLFTLIHFLASVGMFFWVIFFL